MLIMEMPIGSELPRFILCPSCKSRYNDDKKRRVIDSCGHPRCFSCLSKNEVCPLCEKKQSSSNMQRSVFGEFDKSKIERQQLDGKIRARSMSAMMERSLSCGAEIRGRKAASFSRVEKIKLNSNGESREGSKENIKCQDQTNKSLPSTKPSEDSSQTADSKIRINVSAKKMDRKASFSSVLSRNGESFKHGLFRRSSSFSTAPNQAGFNTETKPEYQSRLRIPGRPRPHSLNSIEYERWNEVSFLPTMAETIEHAGSDSGIFQSDIGIGGRRKSLENVLKRATSWLEESKNTLHARSRLLCTGNASCNHVADKYNNENIGAKTDALANNPISPVSCTEEGEGESESLDVTDRITDRSRMERFPGATTQSRESESKDVESGDVKKEDSGSLSVDARVNGANGNENEAPNAFNTKSVSDTWDSVGNRLSSEENASTCDTCSSAEDLRNEQKQQGVKKSLLDVKQRISQIKTQRRLKTISHSCDDIYDNCVKNKQFIDYFSSSVSDSDSDSDSDQSVSSFDDSNEDCSDSEIENIDEDIHCDVSSKHDSDDASYLPAIRQLLYGKRFNEEKSSRVMSPRKNGTCTNPFSMLQRQRESEEGNLTGRITTQKDSDNSLEKEEQILGYIENNEVSNTEGALTQTNEVNVESIPPKSNSAKIRDNFNEETLESEHSILFPSDNNNVNKYIRLTSDKNNDSLLGMEGALSAIPSRKDAGMGDIVKRRDCTGNRNMLSEGLRESVETASRSALNVDENEIIQSQCSPENQTENTDLKLSLKRPKYHKGSWSTSDIEIQYLPSLKKNRRKRPNSLNSGQIEWKWGLIPRETDVDSFCEESFDGEATENGEKGLNEMSDFDSSRQISSLGEGNIELEKGKIEEAIKITEDTLAGSSEAVIQGDEERHYTEAAGDTSVDANATSQISAKSVDLASRNKSTSTIFSMENDVFLERSETALNHEYNIIDGLKIERNSDIDRKDTSTEDRVLAQQDCDVKPQAIPVASSSLIAQDDKSNYRPSRFSHLKQKRFDEISRKKTNRYSAPEIGLAEDSFLHDDELVKNKTDDWKTANSHILKYRTKNSLQNSDIVVHDNTPVVFIADNDLNEPVFVAESGVCKEPKPNAKVENSMLEAINASKATKSKEHSQNKHTKTSEKSRSARIPHGMKYLRNKMLKLTKWSKRGNCLEKEISVNISSKPSDDNSIAKDSDINQNILAKRPVKTVEAKTIRIKANSISEYKASNKEDLVETNKQRISKQDGVSQGSKQGPLFPEQHKQSVVDSLATNEADQASLTSVSTLNVTPPKLDFRDSDDSSILSSDSDDSTMSSRFSSLSDSDSSSDTINASIKDTDMPDFRSPSRIQEDLAALLEKKMTRRRQGLKEIDFHPLLPSSRGKSLISREWLYDIIYQLLLANESNMTKSSRGLIISASYGCGKTSFLKSMIWNNQADRFGSKTREKIASSVLSYHFCFNSDIETTSVARFILNLAANLVDNDDFSAYTKKILDSNEICKCLNPESVERDPETAFKEGVLKPLNAMFKERMSSDNRSPKQYLLIVDINDHCCNSCKANECIVSLLVNTIDLLPKRIKLVITGTKQSVQLLQATEKLHEVSLDNIKNWDVQSDIYNFTELSTQKEFLGDLSKPRIRKLIDNVVKFSQGSFDIATMAIHYVAGYSTSLQKIPSLLSLDFNRLFREIMKLEFGSTERERILAFSLLDVLFVSQEPFTLSNLYKAIENGCSSQPVTYQEFECCMEKLATLHMISESVEGRFSITDLTRNYLVDYRDAASNSNLRKGHNLLSVYYMKTLSTSSGKDIYRLAYHLASSSFGEEIEEEEGRVNFLAWTFGQVFRSSTAGFMEPCNIFHPIESVYHLFLHTDIDTKMFEKTYGKDPLVMASTLSQEDIVKLLLAHKQYSKEILDLALKEAIKNGSNRIVDLLLQRKVDQSVNDASYFDTALESNQLSIAMSLLRRDWPLNQQGIKKEAAQKTLCEACCQGDLRIIKELVEGSDLVDLNDRGKIGRVPIVCAVAHKQVETVKFLVKNGASVNITDKEGVSPLLKAVELNNEEMLDLILDEDSEIDIQDKNGRTPLMIAASHNRCRLIDTLFMEGASLVHQDEYGQSPLALACLHGAAKAVRLLLKNRALVDQTDKADRTPLHHACVNGNAKIVQLLINHGANINHKDAEAYKPIERALASENFKVVNVLLKNNATVRKSCWILAEKSLAGFLCLINYYERRGNSMIKEGKFFEANSYFQRALNKIETSRYRNNKKVQRIKILCQQDSRIKFLQT